MNEKSTVPATEIRHSKISMVSYGFGKFVSEFFGIAFGSLVFFYYEQELGLDSWLAALGFIIYAIWNAVNDPFIGYLTDRPFKFTKKWGRRFPWVIIGGIPWILCWLLIFTPPTTDVVSGAWIIFIWLVFTTCLFDTFYSLYGTNFYSIFPDKFRDSSERRMASSLSTIVGAMGTAAGSIIPYLFFSYGDIGSYTVQAGIVVIVCMIALALALPGCREDQIYIDCYLEACEQETEKDSFFKVLKTSLKHKNFVAYILAFMFYQSLVQTMIGSMNYVGQFVLEVESSMVSIVMAGFLIGAVISMPLWSLLANRTDNDRKTIIIAAISLTVMTFVLFFITDFIFMVIGMIIWGFTEGGYWVMMGPVFANTIDESIVDTGKRREGIYNGINTFVGRFAMVIQAITFAVVHTLTGYIPGSDVQPPSAVLGFRIHLSIIPTIFMAVATFILWKFYTLTPQKVHGIKERLIQMNI